MIAKGRAFEHAADATRWTARCREKWCRWPA